jgi:Family of unknown function (DUF6228)
VSVCLSDLEPFFDEKTFAVTVQANGLSAHIKGASVTPWDNPQLDDFFHQLAVDYTGWDGSREWRSNHLVIDAQFQSGGHVAVTWTLRDGLFAEDRWQVSATTVIEAGEQMALLAADIREFLAS